MEGKVIISNYKGKKHRLIILTDSPKHWFVDNVINGARLNERYTILPAEITITIPEEAKDGGEEMRLEMGERRGQL